MVSVCKVMIPSIFWRKNQRNNRWPDRRLTKGTSENPTYCLHVKGNGHQDGLARCNIPARAALLPMVRLRDDPLDERGPLPAVRWGGPCCAQGARACDTCWNNVNLLHYTLSLLDLSVLHYKMSRVTLTTWGFLFMLFEKLFQEASCNTQI